MCQHHSLLISNPALSTNDLLILNKDNQLKIYPIEYHCG